MNLNELQKEADRLWKMSEQLKSDVGEFYNLALSQPSLTFGQPRLSVTPIAEAYHKCLEANIKLLRVIDSLAR